MTTTLEGRVLRSQSGQYWIETEQGVVHCSLRGRFKKARRAESDLAVIGDRVRVQLLEEPGEGVIEEVLPRANRFARRQPGGRGRYKEDVLVANLDRVFVVFACSTPEMKPRLLDRFLVIAELDRIDVVIVANKMDECDEASARARFGPYEALGYPVVYTSAVTGVGMETLRAHAARGVSAFLGSSGVGKSSLLNTLSPGLEKAVAEISDVLNKGRHTTRVAELHPFGDAAWVADTPGIRELASFEIPDDALADCFVELRSLAPCRFSSCSHDHEPDCSVKDAVADGRVSEARYDSYLRMLRGDER